MSKEAALSKEAAARVRDELLQSLYAGVLRCTLAPSHGRRVEAGEAVAAGLSANLRPEDLLLLPPHRGAGFRLLRGLAPDARHSVAIRDRAAGILRLPKEEASAVAFALGVASAAAAYGDKGTVVCALVPSDRFPPASPSPAQPVQSAKRRTHAGQLPSTWREAGAYAAQLGLPLLLVSDTPSPPGRAKEAAGPAHLLPPPPYPTIPVDREDALAIYRVAFECVVRARAGAGPSHIACMPFSMRAQASPGGDALERLETMLRKRGAFRQSWRRRLERQLLQERSS